MRKTAVASGLLFSCLAACATPAYRARGAGTAVDHVQDVVRQPFADLNVSRTRVPAVLLRAKAAPFVHPAGCPETMQEIAAITLVLGAALSSLPPPNRTGATPQSESETLAWNAARGAAGGLIPFRGVVRWISGADRQDRDVDQDVLSGYVRRAYLEGLAQGQGCASGGIPPERTSR